MDRYRAKAAELGVGVSTLRRRAAAFEQSGPEGLLPAHTGWADAVQMEGSLLRVGTSPALLAQAMPHYEWIITDPPPPSGGQRGIG